MFVPPLVPPEPPPPPLVEPVPPGLLGGVEEPPEPDGDVGEEDCWVGELPELVVDVDGGR